jgi:hypothetical protein
MARRDGTACRPSHPLKNCDGIIDLLEQLLRIPPWITITAKENNLPGILQDFQWDHK